MGLVVGAAIAIGLLFLSRLLYKPPKGNTGGLGEDQPPSISTRGAWIGLHFGIVKSERVVIGWTGAREVRKESVPGGGGGKGGGGSAPKQDVYYEETVHWLGIGPARSLHEIRMNGKIIWQGPIFADDTPSGTEITIGTEGTFVIYWGEADQPVNTYLATTDKLGFASRHPRIAYIMWKPLRYGTSPTQPQMEYVVGWSCAGSSLQESDYLLDDGTTSGVNPAHILHALANGGKFVGAGLALNEIDNDSLEALGALMQAEHLPANFSIEEGPEVARAFQQVLQDCGVMMPVSDGRLFFIPQRYDADADVPVLGDDVILPPDIEQENDHYPVGVTRPVFTFKDEQGFNYREQDISLNDSGQETDLGLSTSERVLLTTFTALSVASKAARRRWQETSVIGEYKLNATRGARLLLPGQPFIREGLGQFRVIGIKSSDEGPETEIDCVLDVYALPDIEDALSGVGGGGVVLAAAEDIAFDFFEIPPELQTGATVEVGVFRLRAHNQIFSASIYLSTNNTTYTQVADQTHSQGGLIEEDLTDLTEDVIVDGPRFEPENDDMEQALDLSSDTTAWQSGKQVAMLKNSTGVKELFFVQRFTPIDEDDWLASTGYSDGDVVRPTGASGLRFIATTTGSSAGTEPDWPTEVGETVIDGGIIWEAHRFSYRPQNMIRARYNSEKTYFDEGDRLFIADADDISPLTIDGLGPGQTLYVKTAPRTSSSQIDVATVTPVSGMIFGDPLDTNVYRVTDDGNVRSTDTGNTRIAD
jgi:hypothetical protein